MSLGEKKNPICVINYRMSRKFPGVVNEVTGLQFFKKKKKKEWNDVASLAKYIH